MKKQEFWSGFIILLIPILFFSQTSDSFQKEKDFNSNYTETEATVLSKSRSENPSRSGKVIIQEIKVEYRWNGQLNFNSIPVQDDYFEKVREGESINIRVSNLDPRTIGFDGDNRASLIGYRFFMTLMYFIFLIGVFILLSSFEPEGYSKKIDNLNLDDNQESRST